MWKTAAKMHCSPSLQYFGLLLIFSFFVSSFKAQSINLVKDTVMPFKGSSFGISCMLSEPFMGSNGIALFRNGVSQVSCVAARGCSFIEGYTFKVNQTGVFMTILRLDRNSHEGIWICTYVGNINSNPFNLVVYTLPTGISFTQEPSDTVDLSMMSATFQCRTVGCSYPDPVIKWMYENQNFSTVVQTSTSDGCTSTEKIYNSTLFIQRNSTLIDNSDKTVIFSCKIDYPDPSINIIANATKSVRFAVRVTEAVLQQNNQNITDILTVSLGEQVVLTCMTGYGRPDPIIDWYIGSQKRGSGPVLNFTPSNADHSEIIYCQAYNTDPNIIVYSLKPRLSVQVRVTEAVLQQNNQNVTDIMTVISGNPISFSCVTGLSRPDPTIDWYIGLQKRGSGPVLNFTPSNADHSEIIYCQAYNTDPNIIIYSLKPRLSVQVYVSNVTLDPPGAILTFLEGTAKGIRCITSPCRPQPVIRWWLDGNEVTDLSNTKVTEINTLFIATSELHLTVEKAQEGKKLHCDAKVEGQVTAAESTKPAINVWYAPDVKVNVSRSTVIGSTAVMMCTAQGNPPNYTFHPWIHMVGQTEIRKLNGVNTLSLSSLALSNISIQDMGTYRCTVDNSITGLNGQINQIGDTLLHVQGPPVIGETQSTLTGETNKSASIEIPFYSNSSIQTLKFIRQSDSFEISNTSNISFYILPANINMIFYAKKVMIPGHVAVIYFRNVKDVDFGSYTLQLINDQGNVSMEFDFKTSGVYVETKTEQPSGGNMPVAAIIGGIIGPAILVIAIVVVAIIVKRRTQEPKMEGLQMNPVYDSSETGPVVQECAVIVKSKRIFGQTEDPSKLYAQVDKATAKKGKTALKGKPGKTSKGDIYENTPLPLKSSRENVYEYPGHLAAEPNSQSVYENPEASATKGHLVNKDVLLYADLKLDPPTTQVDKPVIHGLENRTEYAQIAYGKKGEPLPECDEEKENGGARKNNVTKMKTNE
ncbi:hypothetical protein CHS0354_005150 [Potamilus streckersoni]|uniref:Ig-like domain-containing protein n=1 Tax=Potamilus streckersoni TaxID=2493646 RepID=A0AAE0S3F1_9BIVA|nr:hypothetical protein CHS0354_005150 [Potamilus streckersoni]